MAEQVAQTAVELERKGRLSGAEPGGKGPRERRMPVLDFNATQRRRAAAVLTLPTASKRLSPTEPWRAHDDRYLTAVSWSSSHEV